jgi:hypothetical protein
MERRLQALEDAEAIRNLKARYAALCDSEETAGRRGTSVPRTRPTHARGN